ncbi:GAF domain-containing protein [Pedobacter vanadiisoli]|uniref:GAF domain-containing protein n=1 Tax=Pedobacter vanadiisoli TaxID=1761975 RepID=A0ABW5MM84_9SPHI
MKKRIFSLAINYPDLPGIDSAISFGPFIKYLHRKVKEEQTVKSALYHNALKEFKKQGIDDQVIALEDIYRHELLLEHMYTCLSPALLTEDHMAWGLCAPMQPITFYGTDLMYELLEHEEKDQNSFAGSRTAEQQQHDRLHFIYSFILNELYAFHAPLKEKYHSGINSDTALPGYFHIGVNTGFIEVKAKQPLPELSYRELQQYLSEHSGLDKLQQVLPLSLFELRGISVLTITDVTARQAVENIKAVRLSRVPGNEGSAYSAVIQSLKVLVQNANIEFDLFPFVRVNNKMVYGYVKEGSGLLFSVWGEETLSPEAFQEIAESYAANPNSFYSPDIWAESREMFPWLERFRELNVKSMALLPVFHNQVLVGVLGMHTWVGETFDEKKITLLDQVLGPIAQLLQVYIDEFNLEIENIIKEKYTSIQPAVQWKFNEAAWHYLHDKKKNLPLRTEDISFTDVYPFYGAIDIRNSTAERNVASKADLNLHLSLLRNTLEQLSKTYRDALLVEIIFNCNKWNTILQGNELNTTEETSLNVFLNEETSDYLKLISQSHPNTKKIIDQYLESISVQGGEVYKNRQALEISMQLINTDINNYFEAEREKLQESFPCYFEKFRTDGVEYDIYIGQSIAPDRIFNHFHLKNLRLWQLSSMAAIAKMMRQRQADLPVKLATTQLIFIHNHPIDISFRVDERKFDVEGAYNIRYQMIKKRIDKVLIRNSEERLTQPDKLALIYFNKRDIDDYLPFVKYLQETGVLGTESEDLDLEDLQGLSGLKALRLTIV